MDAEYKRLNRLTAILNSLQAKRLITAPYLAEKFGVSIRTIYRDIRSLEQSGVPIISMEGKGYALVEGYRLPPVSLTQNEALALITAEQLVLTSKDSSLIREFSEAILKIKAVLSTQNKAAADLLSKRVVIGKNQEQLRNSDRLIDIQLALTQFRLMEIEYTDKTGAASKRIIEPFLLYNYAFEDWVLVAFCRVKQDFRTFRLDRMRKITFLDDLFEAHRLTVEQYVKKYISGQPYP